jgi:hypothetical protein
MRLNSKENMADALREKIARRVRSMERREIFLEEVEERILQRQRRLQDQRFQILRDKGEIGNQ